MKLKMLGTGNALVSECYNTCFVISDEDKHLLVDGGGGNTILHNLRAIGLDVTDIHEIFVTHKHIDHIMGIIWMVRLIAQSMKKGSYEGDCFIYGHDEVIGLIRELCTKLLAAKQVECLDKKIHLIEVKDGESREIIGHPFTFFDIASTKAKQFGFMMEFDDGTKLTCCGDEPFNERARAYAEGSRWLLHEAFCLYGERDTFKPYEKNHSTVKDACELATSLGVENLVLYHSEDKNIAHRKELYGAEARQYFSGKIYIPDDLETIDLD